FPIPSKFGRERVDLLFLVDPSYFDDRTLRTSVLEVRRQCHACEGCHIQAPPVVRRVNQTLRITFPYRRDGIVFTAGKLATAGGPRTRDIQVPISLLTPCIGQPFSVGRKGGVSRRTCDGHGGDSPRSHIQGIKVGLAVRGGSEDNSTIARFKCRFPNIVRIVNQLALWAPPHVVAGRESIEPEFSPSAVLAHKHKPLAIG